MAIVLSVRARSSAKESVAFNGAQLVDGITAASTYSAMHPGKTFPHGPAGARDRSQVFGRRGRLQERSRAEAVKVDFGGELYVGPKFEDCPVNCKVSNWREETGCNKMCGGGSRREVRMRPAAQTATLSRRRPQRKTD